MDNATGAGGLNCTNHLLTIDRCSSLATYSYTTPLNQYPVSGEEFRASCDRISEGLKCLKTNGKCLAPFARRSLTTYTNSRSRHSKKLCANLNDPKTVDFWKASECIKSKNKRPNMIEGEKQLISSIQHLALANGMKWETRLHQACCAASVYKTKTLKDIEPECAKYKSVTDDMLDSMVGELLEAGCPEQPRLTEVCNKLPKLTLAKEWKAASLTGAAIDLVVALSTDEPPKN